MPPQLQLDRTILVGTDVAGIYLFHPADLTHRAEAPSGWQYYGFACRKEYEAGRLIVVTTGGDGGHCIRLTSGKLTERERRMHRGAWTFRLRVRHGRVLVDGGEYLPYDKNPVKPPADDYPDWIKLPNGEYGVEVHRIDSYGEPGALDKNGNPKPDALPDFVLRFESMDDIAQIQVAASTPVRMLTELPPQANDDRADSETFEEIKEPLTAADRHVVETTKWLIVPGFQDEVPVSELIYKAASAELLGGTVNQFVLAPVGVAVGSSVILATCDSGGQNQNDRGEWEPWLKLRSVRFCGVAKLTSTGTRKMAQLESLPRDFAELPAEELRSLRSRFAHYAATNAQYRREVRHPDFDVEHFDALKSTEGVTNFLIHHLRIDGRDRLKLLSLSTGDRVRELVKILDG